MRRLAHIVIVLAMLVTQVTAGQNGAASNRAATNEALFEAARAGDTAGIAAALDRGADVNAKARYDVTPLIFAAGGGKLEAVRLLVARGADVNSQDSFYRARAAEMAIGNGHTDVALFLLQNGSKGGDNMLMGGVQADNLALVKAALSSDVTRQGLQTALGIAERLKREPMIAVIKPALDALPAPAPALASAPAFTIDPASLPRYVGTYQNTQFGITVTVTAQDGTLIVQAEGQPTRRLEPVSANVFRSAEANATLTFSGRDAAIDSVAIVQTQFSATLTRVPADAASAASSPSAPAAPRPAIGGTRSAAARNWPSFRGADGGGNGDGQGAVAEWDIATGKNIKWKTPIPGIANSSPIVWGDRIFATTAISATDKSFRTGLYGDVAPVNDLSQHEWKVYALDAKSGKILWERTAFAGAPKVKRHPKGTQANSTPATDGKRVVAAFGSIGLLVAWDVNGKELWRAELGVLDGGWFFDPSFQWGHASSPIIYRNSVILQADVQKGSYIGAWDLATGKLLWKTARADEIPTWGTPALVRSAQGRDELVTNGTKIRGYDPATGALLWTLGPNSEVTVGTPVAGHGLIFVTGGYPPVRPIYAIRPGTGTGEISLAKDAASNQTIAWSNMTDGTYIPTPIVYGGNLITVNNNGIVSAYNAETGQRTFRGRVGTGGAFSASPVAADGRLYLASEDGDVYVVRAEAGLTQIAANSMKEVIMATPAIADGLIVVRTMGHLYGIGE
jgi:outer membrane protein assembly factor BamB